MGYIFIPIVVAVVFLLCCFSRWYVKAPPTDAVVVSGFGYKEPRVVSGRGVFVIPVLQRADTITMRMIKLDVKTPKTGVKTKEGVPLFIDSVVTTQVYGPTSTVSRAELESSGFKTKEDYIKHCQMSAISNFLGFKEDAINAKVNDVLQGNLREIVAEMTVNDVLTQRKEFGNRVMENAKPDLKKMGLEIVTFNIQDIQDAIDSCNNSHGVIEAIGVQQEVEVKKAAAIARANAEKETKIAQAKASQETKEAEVKAERAKAEADQSLILRRAELKREADTEMEKANAAGTIQKQVQEKEIKEKTAEAEIALQIKNIELADKAAEVAKRKLTADIREKAAADRDAQIARADAEKYRQQAEAEAERIRRQNEAEAALYEAEKRAKAMQLAADAALYEAEKTAEGIRKKGEAEATAIRAKALAEAEGIEKKAEAQAKMGDASKLEMMYNVLPDVAAALAQTLNGVDNVTLYGSDAMSEHVGKTTQMLDGFMKSFTAGTGINIGSVVGGMLGAKVAAPQVVKTVDAE